MYRLLHHHYSFLKVITLYRKKMLNFVRNSDVENSYNFWKYVSMCIIIQVWDHGEFSGSGNRIVHSKQVFLFNGSFPRKEKDLHWKDIF